MAIVSVDASGERDFQFVRGSDCTITPEEVDEKLVERSKVLHFGSVSLTRGTARNATIFAARSARQAGVLVSYDPNYRAALWSSEREAQEWMCIPLPLVDVLKISEEELPLLTGTRDLDEGTRLLEARGIRLILVTLGSEGVFCRPEKRCGWRIPTARETRSSARCSAACASGRAKSRWRTCPPGNCRRF